MSTNTLVETPRHAAHADDPAHIRFPGSELAHFMELRGRRIVKACGALWYAAPGRFLMSLPYQAMLDPQPDEVIRLLRETNATGVRFPSTRWSGLDSGLYVFRRREYDLESVHQKHRPRVRRALDLFHVRPATKNQLIAQGRALNLSTMRRQGRYDPEFGEQRRWETLIEAAFACSEISFPAAFVGARMAAYMITCREGGWLHILHQMSRQEDLENFPNHLLTYALTQQAMTDETLETICYGYASLFANGGLHEYKLRFGYELIPHQSAFQLHPAVEPFLNNPLTDSAVRLCRRVFPKSQYIETVESVLKGARLSRRLANAC